MATIAVCNGTARTSKYIIEIALERGLKVKALVRSTSRFYKQTKKRDGLTAHEWSDFDDIDSLEGIIQDVSTFYIALGVPTNEPTSLNLDCVQSICAALRRSVPKGARSPTKIVLLSAFPACPHINMEDSIFGKFLHNNLLNHQYDDLERAQKYLHKQDTWLPFVIIIPGGIVDADEPVSKRSEVQLIEGKEPTGTISYSRLADAMFQAGEDLSNKYEHKYMAPIPTTKVKTSFKDYQSAREVLTHFIKTKIVPVMFRSTIFGMLCVGLGYYVRVRERGNWLAQNLGLDLR